MSAKLLLSQTSRAAVFQVLHQVHDVLFLGVLPFGCNDKEEASVASDQHGVRSVPGYKTGRTGRTGRRPPRLADADTDTEVALIPITDRDGPTREDSPSPSRCLGAALPRYVPQQDCLLLLGMYLRKCKYGVLRSLCDGPRLPGT